MNKLFTISKDPSDKPWLGIVTALVKAIPDYWTVFEGIIEAAPFVRDFRVVPRNVGFQISGDEAKVATASEKGIIGNGNPELLAEFIKNNALPDFILFTAHPARYIPMKTAKDIATTYINEGYRGSITAGQFWGQGQLDYERVSINFCLSHRFDWPGQRNECGFLFEISCKVSNITDKPESITNFENLASELGLQNENKDTAAIV